MTTFFTRAWALGLAFAVLSSAAPAFAGLDVGDRAPAFVGKEFVNSDPLTPKDLRGKLTLYEFIGTG